MSVKFELHEIKVYQFVNQTRYKIHKFLRQSKLAFTGNFSYKSIGNSMTVQLYASLLIANHNRKYEL